MAASASGAVFAGYIIERLLGAGGMGEVYVARHPRLPRSDVHGVGNLIATTDTGRVVDAYTGDYVIPGYPPDGAELGTDGNRIAVATDGSVSGRTLEVWNNAGEVWKSSSEYEPVAIGGKVYVGNLRLF